MSASGSNLPPRDSTTGRFIKRSSARTRPLSVDRATQQNTTITPLPTRDSVSPERRTPPLLDTSRPATPVRPTTSAWEKGKLPLFAPDFDDLGSLSDGAPDRISDVIATSLPRPLLVPALAPPQSSHAPPTASIMTTNHRQHTGPAAMPAHRSRHAPYFSGKAHHSIKDFFREFEELADDCGLTGRQKVEVIVRYVPLDLQEFWRSLAGFVTSDWTGLKRELLKIYDEPSTRHTKEKLRALVCRSAKERMRDEEDVQNFYREFLVLSKPLVDAHRLTTEERNKAFWRGFHKKDRQKMRARLVANNPQRVATEHVAYEDVYQVAKATFSGTDPLDTESDDDDFWGEPRDSKRGCVGRGRDHRSSYRKSRHRRSLSSDSSSLDFSYRHSDERRSPSRETRPKRSDTRRSPSPESRHPRRSPSRESRHRCSDARRSPSPEARHRRSDARRSPSPMFETRVVRFKEPLRKEDERELDDLIRRMRGLATHEEAYAGLYARCASHFPYMAQALPRPVIVQTPTAPTYSVQTAPTPPPLPHQPWPAPAPLPAVNPLPFFRSRARPDACAFCLQPGHRVRECPSAQEYVRTGRALVLEDRISFPNGQPIPNDGTGRGLKHGIDTWLTTQASTNPTSVSFARESPPHFPAKHDTRMPSARIEEVTESHILQIISGEDDSDSDGEDLFQVFAAERRKRESRRSKLPELEPLPASTDSLPCASSEVSTPPAAIPPAPSAPIATATTPSATPIHTQIAPQYRYQSTAEDQRLVSELESWLLEGKLTQTTPAHILAASPTIRKTLVERLRVRRVGTSSYEEAADFAPTDDPIGRNMPLTDLREPAYSLPLREIDILLGNKVVEAGVIDPGSQIIVIREDLAREVNATINADRLLQMEGANGATNWTLGCAEYLPMRIGDISVKVHAHVVERAPFRLLLGRPFQHALLCRIEDLPTGEVEVSVQDPVNPSHRVTIPSRPRKVQVSSVRILALSCLPQSPSPSSSHLPLPSRIPFISASLLSSGFPSCLLSASQSHMLDGTTLVQTYKKVARKVRPVPASLPEDFRTIRRIPSDPLLTLPKLSPRPPDFVPGTRLTQERLDALGLDQKGFLLPEELKLLHHVLKLNELGLAWTEAEKGRF